MNKDYYNSIEKNLKERIKELECLYEIAQLNIEKSNSPIYEVFEEVLNIIIKGWQFPEITEAKINFDHHIFSTPNFELGVSHQEAPIILNSKKRGLISVCYTQETPPAHEGPFLKEERDLINTIAQELSSIIERFENKEEKKLLEQKLRHSDRLATLGELIAGIAHELNEPLGSILGFAQLIEEEHQNDSQLQSDVSKIIKASLHAREVIRKMMIFSKYDEKNINLVDINAILKDGLYLLENRCEKENILITKVLSDGLPSLIANTVQMNQIIVNLVVNAIHAMPEGGDLLLQTRYDIQNVYLIVQDTGKGIPENHIQKIFDPFFTTKEIGTSTGLGLSVVHGIVNSLEGKISVESHLGTGTRFEITFPQNNNHE